MSIFWCVIRTDSCLFECSIFFSGDWIKNISFVLLEDKVCGTEKEDCHRYATCVDTGPGIHHCDCKDGYTGDGKTCAGFGNISYFIDSLLRS